MMHSVDNDESISSLPVRQTAHRRQALKFAIRLSLDSRLNACRITPQSKY